MLSVTTEAKLYEACLKMKGENVHRIIVTDKES
jgi:hypothetical protein